VDELREAADAQAVYREAVTSVEAAKLRRREAFRRADERGRSLAEIGKDAGLSRSRVHQMLRDEDYTRLS
jgi:DNA-directed RNA polymerase specialized sigma24 family protein